MPVQVPDFASFVRAQPIDRGLPTGAVVANAVAPMLLGISQSIQQNKSSRDAIEQFATSVESEDPQRAQMYRTLAQQIPYIDSSVIMGSGSGGGTRAGGGVMGQSFVGDIMKDMVASSNEKQELANRLQLQNNSFGNAFALEKLRQAGDMAQIQSRNEEAMQLATLKGDLALRKQEIAAQLKSTVITPYQRQQLEQEARNLGIKEQSLGLAQERLSSQNEQFQQTFQLNALKALSDIQNNIADNERADKKLSAAGTSVKPITGTTAITLDPVTSSKVQALQSAKADTLRRGDRDGAAAIDAQIDAVKTEAATKYNSGSPIYDIKGLMKLPDAAGKGSVGIPGYENYLIPKP